MKRRHFLGLLACGGLGGASIYSCSAFKYWPDHSTFFNACRNSLPTKLANHEVVLSALTGIDTTQFWDSHVHLIGLGDSPSGIWVNPRSRTWWHPWLYTQFKFYLNASCLPPNQSVDAGYLTRLKQLRWGRGSRWLLLAFDYAHNETGEALPALSAFYTPNDYAALIHQQFPDDFEWLASIHPYRADCVEALERAFAQGARGVKWLPPVMGINPASPLCQRFYQALARLELPLLCHGGKEHAVSGMNVEAYSNPLALRHPLDQGVRVVVAHCATAGNSPDTDQGPNGPPKKNFELFSRLMDEPRYQGLLFGDISAMTQINRLEYLTAVLTRQEWHSRLLYGSDYPLPGVMPVVSLRLLQQQNLITTVQAQVLAQLRPYNSLLFDFVLNRQVQVAGKFFNPAVFHTRSFWSGGKFTPS